MLSLPVISLADLDVQALDGKVAGGSWVAPYPAIRWQIGRAGTLSDALTLEWRPSF
jgi:hypothetical protein